MIKRLLFLLALVLILTAAGCRGEVTSVGEIAITTQIDGDNKPVGGSQQVILSTIPVIYLTAEVINAKQGTAVSVEWRYVTKDQILATELFRGGRNSDKPHEFITGLKPTNSFLASYLILSSLSWPPGSYEALIKLDGRTVKQIGFNIVGSREFDELSKKAMLKKLYLGSRINDQGQMAIPGSNFTQSQEKIYAVALLQGVPPSTVVKATWKYLDANQVITDFSVFFSGSDYLPFEISLERFGRLWPDGLWPRGTYEVALYVDNVLVTTKNFIVS